MPWVSTKVTRTTSSFSSSIVARMRASISWRSGESSPASSTKLERPSEFSAALHVLLSILGDGISGISHSAKQLSCYRLAGIGTLRMVQIKNLYPDSLNLVERDPSDGTAW